jgi:hypothetical protein
MRDRREPGDGRVTRGDIWIQVNSPNARRYRDICRSVIILRMEFPEGECKDRDEQHHTHSHERVKRSGDRLWRRWPQGSHRCP